MLAAAEDKDPSFYEDKELTKPFPKRLLLKKDAEIIVWVDHCKVDHVKFEETERQSRLVEDVFKLLKGVLGQKAVCPEPKEFKYTLRYDRASLKLIAQDEDGKELASQTVITGGPEHWYLAFDLPVNKASNLKYDSASGSLQPKDTNSQFYASVNWMPFGDVAGSPKPWSTEPFSVKLLFKISSRPLDSVGIAAAYSMPKLDGVGVGPLAVFFGHFWTKEDQIAGTVQENSKYAGQWRLGISYSLDDAMKWVKF